MSNSISSKLNLFTFTGKTKILHLTWLGFFITFLVWFSHAPLLIAIQESFNLSDQQIKSALIQQSISNYPGTCACPYQTDRAGNNCGDRSAYKKAGGYDPLCYSNDVTPKMIEEYRNNMRI